MSLLIRSLLAVLLCATLKNVGALKCEDDMNKWFLENGEWTGDIVGKPNNQRIIIDRHLKAFGETWTDGYKVVVRKGRATGEIRFFPKAGFRQPGAFAIRASRMHYDLSFLGNMKIRMTTREDDMNEIERIISQAYPCLKTGNFRPNHAVVVTFTCMLHAKAEKQRDTFQVVVTGNSERTFAIVQYHQLHGEHPLQFGFLERLTRNKYKFTGRSKDRAEELLQSTNGIRNGIWIFDITDKVPRTPELCSKDADECTVTDNGMVHSFDGITQVAPPEFLSVLASTQLDFADDCNFENRIRMEVHGQVKYIELFMGAINNANPEDRFYFTFDRKEGKATLRGPNKRTAEILTFPYTWMQGNKKIVVREIGKGWKVVCDACDYELIYRPDGQEPFYRLRAGPRYAGKLDGYCENYDGNRTNDDDEEF